MLDSPQRLFIDHNKVHPTPFAITQNDNTTLHFGNGIINIVCQADEYNKDTDDIDKWICDYIDPVKLKKYSDIKSKITGRDDLRIGDKKPYSVQFYKDKLPIEDGLTLFSWNIDCGFKNDIYTDIVDNKLYLEVTNDEHIGKKFKLQVMIDDEVNSEIIISIIDMY